MQVIKLSATDSTNTYLKGLRQTEDLDDYTVVVTRAQLKGRGQIGAEWESEAGKNLTFSVLKKFDGFTVADRFLLNICTSLAIFDSLKQLSVPDLSIKWPNDILSGTRKICGILIENTLLGEHIQASVIGIGLNVNQASFNTLSNAASLKLLLGRSFNLDQLLTDILGHMKIYFTLLEKMDIDHLWMLYGQALFRKDKPSTFEDDEGHRFTGFIRDVSRDGKLIVELEDAVLSEFDLKEIRLLY